MNYVLTILSCYLVGWFIGTNVGWYITRGRKGDPWNWRVLVGPGPYLTWLGTRNPEWWRK